MCVNVRVRSPLYNSFFSLRVLRSYLLLPTYSYALFCHCDCNIAEWNLTGYPVDLFRLISNKFKFLMVEFLRIRFKLLMYLANARKQGRYLKAFRKTEKVKLKVFEYDFFRRFEVSKCDFFVRREPYEQALR